MQVEDDDSDDDPVVRELDVYLSQNLPGTRDAEGRSDGVFLFQYPLRPKWQALSEGWRLDKVSYRPQHQMVELEMVSGLVSQDTGETAPFRHKLVSSSVAPKATYAIGMMRGEQLHLTPLQAVMQFRPRFDHKDEEDAARKKNAAAGGREVEQENMEEGDDGSDGEQQLSTVQVRVHKRESDKAKEIRRSSHAYMREQEDKEAWKTVEMFPPDAPETRSVRDKLMCGMVDEIDFSMLRKDYLASLNAISKSRDDGVPAQTIELSREKLMCMSLEDQVEALMSAAHVLHFSRLIELVPNGLQHANDVLKFLPETSLLVQGCWVVKSELVYADSGPGDSMRRCRDHILSHFNTGTRLTASSLRKDLTKEVPPASLDAMLFQLAIRREGAWEFRLAPDADFVETHPDVMKTQAQLWVQIEAGLTNSKAAKPAQPRAGGGGKAGGKAAGDGGSNSKGGGGAASSSSSASSAGAGRGGGAGGSLDTQAKEAAVAAVMSLLKKEGVATLGEVGEALVELKNPKLADASAAEAVIAAMGGTLLGIQGGYILKKLMGSTPQAEAQRNVVIELFKAKSSIKKADLVTAIKDKTGEDLAPSASTKLLREFSIAKGTSWVFKSAQ